MAPSRKFIFSLGLLSVALLSAGLASAQSIPARSVADIPPPPMAGFKTPPSVESSASKAPIAAPQAAASSAVAQKATTQPLGAPGAESVLDILLPASPARTTGKPASTAPEACSTASPQSSVKPKAAIKPKAGSLAEKQVAPVVRDPFSVLSTTQVSDTQLNQFIFPDSVEGVYFSEGAPLPACPENAKAQDPCKPVFLNGRTVMLLQLRAGAKGPIQVLAHMTSGRIITLNLDPSAGPGTLVRVDGADFGASDARRAQLKSSQSLGNFAQTDSEQAVGVLSRFAKGDIPEGFEAIPVGSATRFDYFDLVPRTSWSDGGQTRVHLMEVRAFGATPVAINAGLFQGLGIKAVALDRETITDKSPALLYVLEQVEEAK